MILESLLSWTSLVALGGGVAGCCAFIKSLLEIRKLRQELGEIRDEKKRRESPVYIPSPDEAARILKTIERSSRTGMFMAFIGISSGLFAALAGYSAASNEARTSSALAARAEQAEARFERQFRRTHDAIEELAHDVNTLAQSGTPITESVRQREKQIELLTSQCQQFIQSFDQLLSQQAIEFDKDDDQQRLRAYLRDITMSLDRLRTQQVDSTLPEFQDRLIRLREAIDRLERLHFAPIENEPSGAPERR
jgi:DNA repair exonuclease SbcCD ATPase subunit